MNGGPYEVLGVARDATAADIRKAYFRLVRRHTPEDSPEEFARISEAYQLLSDPDARRRFDEEQAIPPASRALVDEAASHLEESPTRAAALARKILARSDQPDPVRLAAASICLRADDPDAAIPYLEELIERSPDHVGAICRLAGAYAQKRKFATAGGLLRPAIERMPEELELRVALARLYWAAEKIDRALGALDDAVAVHGPRHPASIQLHFLRLSLLSLGDRWEEMDRVARDIRAAIPGDDEDLRRHVASRYVDGAFGSLPGRAFEFAEFLLSHALALHESEELREKLAEVVPWANAQNEARIVVARADLPKWIRSLIGAVLTPGATEEDFHRHVNAAAAELARSPKRTRKEWLAFRKSCPAAAQILSELRDSMLKDIRESRGGGPVRRGAAGGRQTASAGAQGFGIFFGLLMLCLFVVRACNFQSSTPSRQTEFEQYREDLLNRYGPNRGDSSTPVTPLWNTEEGLTTEGRERFYDSLSPETREALRKLGTMSPDEKRKFIDDMLEGNRSRLRESRERLERSGPDVPREGDPAPPGAEE